MGNVCPNEPASTKELLGGDYSTTKKWGKLFWPGSWVVPKEPTWTPGLLIAER